MTSNNKTIKQENWNKIIKKFTREIREINNNTSDTVISSFLGIFYNEMKKQENK